MESLARLVVPVDGRFSLMSCVFHTLRHRWLPGLTRKPFLWGSAPPDPHARRAAISPDAPAFAQIVKKKEKIKYTLEKSWKPKVLSETEITMEPSFYINMTTKTSKLANKINMSQCLGHDGICGKSDNRNDYILDPNKNDRIVGASDGLWDVLMEKDNQHLINRNNNAKDLVDMAYQRWEQDWNYVWRGRSMGKQKLDRRDDICCLVYDL